MLIRVFKTVSSWSTTSDIVQNETEPSVESGSKAEENNCYSMLRPKDAEGAVIKRKGSLFRLTRTKKGFFNVLIV